MMQTTPEWILFWLGAATLVTWIAGGLEVILGGRSIRFLRDVPPAPPGAPAVSVIVAARNEERHLERAMRSVAGQVGIDLEIVVVDDRSDDGTGQILDEVARSDARFRIIHLDHLPSGWLGKTHALHTGAAGARGEWLLFMDGDIEMEPQAIARGLGYALQQELDHLAVTPELRMSTPGTDLFGGTFILLFSRYAKPWKARDRRSRRFIGIGAFNLVRREAYELLGGHSKVALRPDDDMALGKIIKQAGFRQDVLYGTGEIGVEWYPSLGEAIRGLEKNAFAGFGYSVTRVLSGCAALLTFAVWPWLAVLLTSGPTRWVNLLSVMAMVLLYVASSRSGGAKAYLALGMPVAIGVLCYAILRSTFLALARGEVRWRGTAYRLDDLRRNRI